MNRSRSNESATKLTSLELMVSGAVARVWGQVLLHPWDTIKTRLQIQGTGARFSKRYDGSFNALKRILTEEGSTVLYRGLGTRILYIMPAAGFNFLCYEHLAGYFKSKSARGEDGNIKWYAFLLPAIGMFSGRIFGSFVRTPFDVIKQRQQVHGAFLGSREPYQGLIREIIHKQGVWKLFSMTHVSLMRDIPFMCFYFCSYEFAKWCQEFYLVKTWRVQNDLWMPNHLIAGAFSGFVACITTSPFDVIKTRLQVQQTLPEDTRKYASVRHCFRSILREEGMRGFFGGIVPRLAYVTPLATVIWVSYEFVKTTIFKIRYS